MTRYTISIGLFDKDTKKQKFSSDYPKNFTHKIITINKMLFDDMSLKIRMLKNYSTH